MAVVDSSVVVAAVKRDEPGHTASRAWLDAMRDRGLSIAAPAVLLPEVGGAVARSTGRQNAARRLVQGLRDSGLVDLLPVTDALASRAAEIAIAYGVRGCDAVFMALAEARGESLVTLDREQLERGPGSVAAVRPEEALAGLAEGIVR